MGGQQSTHESANDHQWRSPRLRALIDNRDVGGVIRFARQLWGWKQSDLGQAAGYSASTISRLETGKRAGVDLQMLRDVAEAAGVPGYVLGALIAPAVTVIATTDQAKEDDSMRRRARYPRSPALPAR
ncbi:helix-turn-helix transcriptional regulator [Streptosporangium sp. NPDC049644]|uniref:helix-turn-helix domain-containing protein n=1 Tax=Streptosporangium sp. NPDC049644 TaxID=3155507 RepID=UPI003417154F